MILKPTVEQREQSVGGSHIRPILLFSNENDTVPLLELVH